MLCEKCGKNTATTHYKENINGTVKEMFLCSDCAKELGMTSQFFGFNSFFMPSARDTQAALRATKRCECGTRLDEIIRSGFVGCEKCYETFKEELMRSVKKMHGATKHRGRLPDGTAQPEAKTEEEKLAAREKELKKKLNDAIKSENFEEAARLRDAIKELRTNE